MYVKIKSWLHLHEHPSRVVADVTVQLIISLWPHCCSDYEAKNYFLRNQTLLREDVRFRHRVVGRENENRAQMKTEENWILVTETLQLVCGIYNKRSQEPSTGSWLSWWKQQQQHTHTEILDSLKSSKEVLGSDLYPLLVTVSRCIRNSEEQKKLNQTWNQFMNHFR